MCGRFAQTAGRGRYADMLALKAHGHNFGGKIPEYDLRPGQCPDLIRRFGDSNTIVSYYWGWLPHGSADAKGPNGIKPINAKVETVRSNGLFRHAWATKRALVPADAIYEWLKLDAKHSQRYCFRREDEEPMMLGALWDIWPGNEQHPERIPTCVILTRPANAVFAPIHDRMPLILPASTWADWLSPDITDAEHIRSLVNCKDPVPLRAFPVGNQATGETLYQAIAL